MEHQRQYDDALTFLTEQKWPQSQQKAWRKWKHVAPVFRNNSSWASHSTHIINEVTVSEKCTGCAGKTSAAVPSCLCHSKFSSGKKIMHWCNTFEIVWSVVNQYKFFTHCSYQMNYLDRLNYISQYQCEIIIGICLNCEPQNQNWIKVWVSWQYSSIVTISVSWWLNTHDEIKMVQACNQSDMSSVVGSANKVFWPVENNQQPAK